VANLVLADADATNSRDDLIAMGSRDIRGVTVFQSHFYCPGCLGGGNVGGILEAGYNWTFFRNAETQISNRTPFVTYHNEFNPNAGNAPDLSIEIINNVFAMGELSATVHGTGIARGAAANVEDNVYFGMSVTGNATPGIDNVLVNCQETVSSTSESGFTGAWINFNTGGVCEEAPVNCGDVCESSGGAYINNNAMFSTHARAPRVRPSDWKSRSTPFSTPHTLPRWDFAVDGDHQAMAHDVVDHAGSFPRQATAATNLAAALTEIDAATLALRGEANEDIGELDTAGHLTEVASPVYSGDVAFASGSGDDAILYANC
jgi:hypothetical protein